MDIEVTKQLFDRLLLAEKEQDVAEKALKEFMAENKEPQIRLEYETLEEYQADSKRLKSYLLQKEKLSSALAVAKRRFEEIEQAVRAGLPNGVWFKHGDVGIGVAYTNWGGSRYYIVIERWRAMMPSLDRRYKGD